MTAQQRYDQSAKGPARRRRYNSRPKGRARAKRYAQSDKGKAANHRKHFLQLYGPNRLKTLAQAANRKGAWECRRSHEEHPGEEESQPSQTLEEFIEWCEQMQKAAIRFLKGVPRSNNGTVVCAPKKETGSTPLEPAQGNIPMLQITTTYLYLACQLSGRSR
jgi:hypothetical protein